MIFWPNGDTGILFVFPLALLIPWHASYQSLATSGCNHMRAAEPVAAFGRRCKLFAPAGEPRRSNESGEPSWDATIAAMDRLAHHQPSAPPAITSALPSSRSSANGCRCLAGSLARYYEIVQKKKGRMEQIWHPSLPLCRYIMPPLCTRCSSLAGVLVLAEWHRDRLANTTYNRPPACHLSCRVCSWGQWGSSYRRFLPRNKGGCWTIRPAAPHDCGNTRCQHAILLYV